MPDVNELRDRALLAAAMAERYGLVEVSEALAQAMEHLPGRAVVLARPIAEARRHR